MCSRLGTYLTLFIYATMTGTIFLILALKNRPLEIIFVLVLSGVVLYSILFFIQEERRLQGALNTVFSKLCLFRNECTWERYGDYDVESENLKCCGKRKVYLFNDCDCNQQKSVQWVKDLDKKYYNNKTLEESAKNSRGSTSVCTKFDSTINESTSKKTSKELSDLNNECLKYAKYDCSSGCDVTCTFRQKRLEIYRLIQTLIDLDYQCSCPESVEFLKDLKQFVTCEKKTTTQWWDEYQTLKIPPSCCNLNWYMTLQRAGSYGLICKMHKNPNCPQEEGPLVTNCFNEKPSGKISDQKSHKGKKEKKDKKGKRRFGNWFKRTPKKKKSNT